MARPVLSPDVPVPERTPGLSAASVLDAAISGPIALMSSMVPVRHYALASAELDDAARFYVDRGWVADPALRHPAPLDVPRVSPEPDVKADKGVEVLGFDSDWAPVAGEPGAARWVGFAPNTRVPVRVLRHPGGPRPWLVVVHGQGMGRPGDLKMLRVRRLHDELGVNLALPVLPLHGPRAMGYAPDRQFVSNVYLVNNILGLTQAIWDVRRLLLWLREVEGAPSVGVFGLSLGSYVVSLLSTLEAELACVIAVVPTSDLAAALRRAEPVFSQRRILHHALHDGRSSTIHHVVSPLARPCLVPHDRRHIIAGQVDRIAAPAGAAALWRHWGEPDILWRPRGHLTTSRAAPYDDHLTAIMTTSGLVGGA